MENAESCSVGSRSIGVPHFSPILREVGRFTDPEATTWTDTTREGHDFSRAIKATKDDRLSR